MPRRDADPHTPAIDQQGIVWFTNEQSGLVGRLDPQTGEVKLKEVPTPHAIPYGIVITSKGVPIFCEFGSNKLASIDPKTMQIVARFPVSNCHPGGLTVGQNQQLLIGCSAIYAEAHAQSIADFHRGIKSAAHLLAELAAESD